MDRPIDLVLERLANVRQVGGRYLASSPTRRDSDPSLWIAEGERGQVLLKDFGGSTVEEIVAALDLEMSDLFIDGPREWRQTMQQVPRRAKERKPYVTPAIPDEPTFGKGMQNWFEKRGITEQTLQHFGVYSGEHFFRKQPSGEHTAICFPYWYNEIAVNVKYRRADLKDFAMETDAMPVFYNSSAITPETKTIVIAEGEIDVLTIWQVTGMVAISPPNGQASITDEVMETANFLTDETIRVVLAGDMDGPGQKMLDDLARRIGKERCSRVSWPDGCKDANETLMTYGVNTVQHCIDRADPLPVEGIIHVSDIMDQIWSLYNDGLPPGESTGIRALDEHYTIKKGYYTTVTGSPGSGKSNLLDQITVNLAETVGWKFGIASLENRFLARHAANILPKRARKPFGTGKSERISRDEMEEHTGWMNDHFHFIQPREPSIAAILSRAHALVFSHGIDGLIIDPWNQLDHPPNGLANGDYISTCLSMLNLFAFRHDIHIWLVAHPTKLQKDGKGMYPVPTLYDISGSAHFFNKTDFGFSSWRNYLDFTQPVQFHMQKSRHQEIASIGKVELGYDPITTRYYDLAASGEDTTSYNWRPQNILDRAYAREEQEFFAEVEEDEFALMEGAPLDEGAEVGIA